MSEQTGQDPSDRVGPPAEQPCPVSPWPWEAINTALSTAKVEIEVQSTLRANAELVAELVASRSDTDFLQEIVSFWGETEYQLLNRALIRYCDDLAASADVSLDEEVKIIIDAERRILFGWMERFEGLRAQLKAYYTRIGSP